MPYSRPRPHFKLGWRLVIDPRDKEKKVIKNLLLPYSLGYTFSEVTEIGFIFLFAFPKSWSKKKRKFYTENICHHTSKPDGDNLAKLYLDCMKGLFFEDDSSIKIKYNPKFYTPNESKTIIRIYPKSLILTPEEIKYYDVA